MGNALLVIEALTQALSNAQKLSALLQQAHAQGRDVTDAELAGLRSDDDAAKAALDQAIAKAP